MVLHRNSFRHGNVSLSAHRISSDVACILASNLPLTNFLTFLNLTFVEVTWLIPLASINLLQELAISHVGFDSEPSRSGKSSIQAGSLGTAFYCLPRC